MSRSIIFSLSLLTIISAHAMDTAKFEQINKIKKMASLPVFSPGQDGQVKVFHNGKNFFVKEKHQASKQIHNYDVDPLLQKMTPEQLDTFQKTAGFLVAKRLSNGEYKLDAHVKGLGGGPYTASLFYWATKTLCYGTALAATGAAVVSTGGAAGAISGALVAATTSGAGTATTVTAAAIVGAGGTEAATVATTYFVTAAGGAQAAITAVESASTVMGVIGMMLPLP